MGQKNKIQDLSLPELIEKIENYPFSCEAGDLRKCWDWEELKRRMNELMINCPSCGRHDFGLQVKQATDLIRLEEKCCELQEQCSKLKSSEAEAREGWMSEYEKTEDLRKELETYEEKGNNDFFKGIEEKHPEIIEFWMWVRLKKYVGFLETHLEAKNEWTKEDKPMQEDHEILAYRPGRDKSVVEYHNYYNTAEMYLENKVSKQAIRDLLNWILVKSAKNKNKLLDEIQHHVDDSVYYRNLCIRLGAKPEQMVNSFDKNLCKEGLGEETSWTDDLETAWDIVEKCEKELRELEKVVENLNPDNWAVFEKHRVVTHLKKALSLLNPEG